MSRLSHVDTEGKATMVDVNGKATTNRRATAAVTVKLNEGTFLLVKENRISKGDVLTVAKIAAIQAAKKTSELIPLCHPIPLSHVDIGFELHEESHSLTVRATVKASTTTGVEMEAFTACAVAALTIYDMVKAVQKDVIITDLKLIEKKGGKSGEFRRTGL